MENYSSESFLPLLADMLRKVCSSNLPSHVDYMIGLLPHSLAEQNNYSISLLQSAVAALRSRLDRKGSSTLVSVRVIIPDERNGTLIRYLHGPYSFKAYQNLILNYIDRKMVPIRETTTTKEVSKMVASKIGIANPGDYVLVRIKNGEGT
jgi:hypothetical protein